MGSPQMGKGVGIFLPKAGREELGEGVEAQDAAVAVDREERGAEPTQPRQCARSSVGAVLHVVVRIVLDDDEPVPRADPINVLVAAPSGAKNGRRCAGLKLLRGSLRVGATV